MDIPKTIEDVQVQIAAVLTTLLDTEGQNGEYGASCSVIYLTLGHDLNFWNRFLSLLRAEGMVYSNGTTMHLTKKGRELAKELKKENVS